MRDEIMNLLNREKISSVPAFSGLIHVTTAGLSSEGLALHEAHHDAEKMAKAAASTFKLTGMPSAALPLDLCAPAEAMGAELLFYKDDLQFPQVKKLLFQSAKELLEAGEVEISGRIGLICEAIRLLKMDLGDRAVISGIIPGPYTLMIYICKVQNLVREMKNEPRMVLDALFHLSSFLARIGNAYRQAGADFITIHEMGGSPGFIGPKPFEQFVLPALQRLTSGLPGPTALSVCGKTDSALSLLAQTGADAISLDQTSDLPKARMILKDKLLFGNLDPVGTLLEGDPARVVEAAQKAKEAGVDAVWPGCDLVPQTPVAHIRALML